MMEEEKSPTIDSGAVEQMGGIRETYRKPLEVTPDEGHIINCYTDLQTRALSLDLTQEETANMEADLRELYQHLTRGSEMDETFRKDMKDQVKRLASNFISIKNIKAKFRELEAGTRGGEIPWGVRDEIINLIAESRERYGLADSVYNAFIQRLGDYEISSGAGNVLYRNDDK